MKKIKLIFTLVIIAISFNAFADQKVNCSLKCLYGAKADNSFGEDRFDHEGIVSLTGEKIEDIMNVLEEKCINLAVKKTNYAKTFLVTKLATSYKIKAGKGLISVDLDVNKSCKFVP